MYFVGIDISKYKHDCCIINEMQQIIARFTFNNNQQGFTELEAYLNSVPKPDDEMRIGFEATSHYALNLKLFLEENHHSFMEFKPFFNNTLTTTALYIIENYPSAERISRLTTASYSKINCVAHGQFSADKFAKLKQLAKDSVGQSNEFLETELLLNIRIFKNIDFEISKLEKQITEIVRQVNPHFLTIKGMGVITAATILAECGDIHNFPNADKLLAFAGLEPGIYQSGTSEKGGKMVKHGSAYLRYALLNCVTPLIKCNVTFASYYNKKIAEGKPHRVVVTHVAKKLIRVIYTLEIKGIDYDENLLR